MLGATNTTPPTWHSNDYCNLRQQDKNTHNHQEFYVVYGSLFDVFAFSVTADFAELQSQSIVGGLQYPRW